MYSRKTNSQNLKQVLEIVWNSTFYGNHARKMEKSSR